LWRAHAEAEVVVAAGWHESPALHGSGKRERQEAGRGDIAMKILITGSTGLIGRALVGELKRAGHTVCRLLRPGTSGEELRGGEGFDVRWDPSTGELGAAGVGADAVVNLAGASIADGRWTAARKKVLRDSRVETTRALVNALAKMAVRPRVLVSASAIGFYGDRGEEILAEESQAGGDFLSEVAKEWEGEAMKAEALGIRAVRPRFGVVLAKEGGALPQMARPFRLGVGGRIGSGQQWMSWVSVEDVVGVVRMALENGDVRGAVNVVAPEPVRNVDFTRALAAALHRPALFPAPAFALRLVLGEMADALLLSSARVLPAELGKLGYKFVDTDLRSTLVRLFAH
jgi:uncharacterized protein